MTESASMLSRFRSYLCYPVTIIHKIFDYLSGNDNETGNNRILLRSLYNAGYLDDGKYQDLCEKNSNDNFDPEELSIF